MIGRNFSETWDKRRGKMERMNTALDNSSLVVTMSKRFQRPLIEAIELTSCAVGEVLRGCSKRGLNICIVFWPADNHAAHHSRRFVCSMVAAVASTAVGTVTMFNDCTDVVVYP